MEEKKVEKMTEKEQQVKTEEKAAEKEIVKGELEETTAESEEMKSESEEAKSDTEEIAEEQEEIVTEEVEEEPTVVEEEPKEELELEPLTKKEQKEQKKLARIEEKEKKRELKNSQKEMKKEQNQKTIKKLAKIAGVILGIFLIAYIASTIFFMYHFQFSTTINGMDVSLKSISETEERMKIQVHNYTIVLNEITGDIEEIKGEAIQLEYKPVGEIKEVHQKKSAWKWVLSLREESSYEIALNVEYSDDLLVEELGKLECMNKRGKVAPTNAIPVFNGETFEVQEEQFGTELNVEIFTEEVRKYIKTLDKIPMDMKETGSYLLPRFVKDSPEVLAANAELNRFISAEISYSIAPLEEVVDKSVIAEWMLIDEEMNVSLNREAVAVYVNELCQRINTYGTVRTLVTPTGKTVEVSGGDLGWQINEEEELNTLLANLDNKEVIEREPIYSRRGRAHGELNDYGTIYAAVDITEQYMWFIKDGEVVLETPIVTGRANTRYATPQGSFTVTYTQRGAILRGRIQPDGTREYETPVAYWMPFNGGIGFHDATWQPWFGGDRYVNGGSHGCINMPLDKAAELFSYLEKDMVVVCHY